MNIALRLITLFTPILLSAQLAVGQGQIGLVSAKLGPGPYRLEIWYALGQTQDESLLRPLPGGAFNYTNSVLTPRPAAGTLLVPDSFGGSRRFFRHASGNTIPGPPPIWRPRRRTPSASPFPDG